MELGRLCIYHNNKNYDSKIGWISIYDFEIWFKKKERKSTSVKIENLLINDCHNQINIIYNIQV